MLPENVFEFVRLLPQHVPKSIALVRFEKLFPVTVFEPELKKMIPTPLPENVLPLMVCPPNCSDPVPDSGYIANPRSLEAIPLNVFPLTVAGVSDLSWKSSLLLPPEKYCQSLIHQNQNNTILRHFEERKSYC